MSCVLNIPVLIGTIIDGIITFMFNNQISAVKTFCISTKCMTNVCHDVEHVESDYLVLLKMFNIFLR